MAISFLRLEGTESSLLVINEKDWIVSSDNIYQ